VIVEEDVPSAPGTANPSIQSVRSSANYTLSANLTHLTLTGSDAINGTGNATNNRLTGNAGNNVLSGAAGDDVLLGGDGDDTLAGGSGDDTLVGGAGDDTYVFSRGDGSDLIDNTDLASATNAVRFGAGIDPLDVIVIQSLGNLYLKIRGTQDVLTVLDYFAAGVVVGASASEPNAKVVSAAGVAERSVDVMSAASVSDHKLDLIGFANGVVWDQAFVQNLVNQSANNHAPTVAGTVPNLLAHAGIAFTYTVPAGTIVDQDVGDSLTYSLTLQDGSALPTWLSFDAATRTLGGTAVTANLGSLQFLLKATDNYGAVATVPLSLNIQPNRTPVVSSPVPDQAVSRGIAFTFSFSSTAFADPDAGDSLTYAATMADGTALPAWLTFDAVSRSFSGIAPALGITSVRVSAQDTQGLVVSDLFDFVVQIPDIVGSAGADVLNGGTENETLRGLGGNDQLFGGAGTDRLFGDAGDDSLDGGTGVDSMSGGSGNDTYWVDEAGDVVSEAASEGMDTVVRNVETSAVLADNVENLILGSTIRNGAGNALGNVITGNALDNALAGLGGNDTLVGGIGFDTLDGGTGSDSLTGGLGDDIYLVDQSDDAVIELAGEGNDTVKAITSYMLAANVENLVLESSGGYINGTGNTLANRITGNNYNNRLDGGAGIDTLEGGLGDDTYVVDSLADQIVEALDGGRDTVEAGFSYTLGQSLEALTLVGTANIDGTGNDTNNILIGNIGNNRLDGGLGADDMSGGLGDDTYIVEIETDSVHESFGEGVDTIQRSYETLLVLDSNVENLTLTGTVYRGNGNELNNVITGNAEDNNLSGLAGADTLIGGLGNDAIFGGEGQDSLIGGAGDDYYEIDDIGDSIVENANEGDDFVRATVSWTLGANQERLAVDGSDNLSVTGNTLNNGLWGNFGNNTVTGGLGNDYLVAGQGNDEYVFNKGDGQDSIDNTDIVGAVDTLRFGAGITEADVSAFQYGNNMFLKVKGGTDQIGFIDYYAADTTVDGQAADHKIDRVVFASGVVWDQAMIQTVVNRATNNRAPTINANLPTLQASVGSAFNYTVAANTITDPDAWDSITYSVKMPNGSAVPTWLTFDATTRIFSGTPAVGNVGNLQFVLWGTDNYGSAVGTYVNLNVGAANVAPTATNLSAAEAYTEDTAKNLVDIVVTDTDSANTTVTLTLSNVAAGSLNAGTSGTVTSTYNVTTGVWTASGAKANVNTLLAALTFTPAANFNGNFSIATSVSDGVAAAITGSKAFTGTAVNDAPTATNLSAAEAYTEDTAKNLVGILVADIDSANVTATLTLSNIAAGSLNVGTSGAVTSTYNAATGVWSASGATANVNTLLAALTFTPVANFNGNFTIATSVSDAIAPAVTGSKAFTGTAVNDAPTGIVTIAGTPTQGQTLTVANTLADVDGLGTIAYQWKAAGVAISGATASTFVLTSAQVGKAITVSASYTDGKGTAESVASSATALVAGPANLAPTATNLSAAEAYTEDTAKNLVDIMVTDTDSANITVKLTLSNVAAGSLTVGTSGTVTSTYAAGTGVWTASGVKANVNTLLAALSFTPTANFNGNFSIATSVSDGVAPAVTGSKAFTGTAVNDLPTGSVTIAGTAKQGQTLTAGNTLADVDGLGTIGYQWKAAGVAISGATTSTFVLTSAQVGKAITVTARYTDGKGTAESVTSSATPAVAVLALAGRIGADSMADPAGKDSVIVGSIDLFTQTHGYLGNRYDIDQFKTSNGKTLLDSQVQNLVSAMAGFAPPAAGQTLLAANYATTLTPVLAANWV
jgi:Ca2+-binding RTX toxin-like protein